VDILGEYLWTYYECGGDPAAIRARLTGPQPLVEVLLQIQEQSGRAGLQQALNALRHAPADPENNGIVAAWLKESLNVH